MTSPSFAARAKRLSSLAASVGALLVMLLHSRSALAEDAVDLSWDAPPGCPRVGAVRERLRALRGTQSRVNGRLRAEGRIVRIDGRFRLILGVHEGNAVLERKIDADSCKDLAGAAAVALALLLRDDEVSREPAETPGNATEPGAPTSEDGKPRDSSPDNTRDESHATANPTRAENRPSERRPEATPEQRPEKTSTEPQAMATDSASKRSWRVVVHPLATLDVGPLPRPAGAFGLGVGVKSGAWKALVVGRNTIQQTVSSSALAEARADVHRMTLELWACRSWRRGIVEGGPCLALAGERTSARGSGLGVSPSDASALGFGLGPGGTVELHATSWLALAAHANLLFETSRPRLVLDALGEVSKLGAASLSLGLGAELAF